MTLDVAFAFDAAYAAPAQAAVEGVLTSGGLDRDATVWLLLDTDVDAAVVDDFTHQVGDRCGLGVLRAGERNRDLPLSNSARVSYISAAMHLRLFLPDLLPASVDRVLYLDVDVLCTGSLAPLGDLDLGGLPCAAVRDAFTYDLGGDDGLPGMAELPGARPETPYFNSGVLLIDTARWRALGVADRCLDYLREHRDSLRFPDQDALNHALHGRWRELGPQWNHMCSWELEPEVGGTVDGVSILHTPGPGKLWHDDFPDGERKRRYRLLQDEVRRRGRSAPGERGVSA